MRSLTFTGRVGTQPEAKRSASGNYVKFRLATQEYGEDEPWWFTVLCYNKKAEIILKNLKKGDYLAIQGALLAPLPNSNGNSGTVRMFDFEWLKTRREEPKEKPVFAHDTFELTDDDFNVIPETPDGPPSSTQ